MTQPYYNVYFEAEPEPTLSYRSALTVYEESFIKGRFVGRSWNGAGFLNFYQDRFDPTQHFAPQAFWVEIDGQLLNSDWEWQGWEQHEREAAQNHTAGLQVTVTLKHKKRPVTVKVHTLIDGTPIFTRWLEIQNTGTHEAALSAAYSWSGVLQKINRWQRYLPDLKTPLYSIGYMTNPHWGNEGDFQWHDLPQAGYRVDGRYRRDRHRHPMFVLRNNATGEHFIGQLEWTGGYSFEFDLDADGGTTDQAARLWFRAGPDAPAPQRLIAAGETILTPALHLGMVFGDLDSAIQGMHDHLRQSVMGPQPRGRGNWVESGIGPEVEITPDYVKHHIDLAADIGCEVFFIDASWYGAPKSHWWTTVGDWQVDRERFPQGFEPLRNHAHEKGLLWGLWMDAERIGKNSAAAIAHPEWVGTAYDGEQRLSDVLDLTNPAAAQWMQDQIAKVLTDYQCDFFRLDYNVASVKDGMRAERENYIENGYWRYYEVLYGIYDRLRARFPNIIFENCAGGGGRTDVGLVRRFSHTWVTDWQIAPRSFSITNGMTMALPPEYVDRLVGGQAGHSAAEYDFQIRLLMFCRPSMAFFHPLGTDWNPIVRERTQHYVSLYKDFIRPFMPTSRIYHHTPALPSPEPQGWGVLELASQDRTRAIAGVFQLSSPQSPDYVLRLRGLDVGKRYRVTFDNHGQTCEIDGFTLMQQGLTLRLAGALTSEFLLIEAVSL